MSFLKNIFGGSNEEHQPSKINWIPLTNLVQLNEITIASNEKPIAIFKHSTRCSVSRMALKQFENEYALNDNEVTPYFLDLITFRDVSNEIASHFQVMHQSPQLILIKNGNAVYHVSHNEIDALELKTKV